MAAKRSVHLRAVALPAEHGAWGFLLESMLLGLVAVSSPAGFLFCLGMLRCAWGLSPYRPPASRPAIIGIQEMFFGLIYAVLLGLAV